MTKKKTKKKTKKVKKEKKIGPFDAIKCLNSKKEITEEEFKSFSVWLTNTYFSSSPIFIGASVEMNKPQMETLPKKAIYDFYNIVIPKNHTFLPFPKASKTPDEIVEYQKEHLCSSENARVELDLLQFIKENE